MKINAGYARLTVRPKGRQAKFRIKLPTNYGRIVNSTNIGGKDYAADGSEVKSTSTGSRQRLLLKIAH